MNLIAPGKDLQSLGCAFDKPLGNFLELERFDPVSQGCHQWASLGLIEKYCKSPPVLRGPEYRAPFEGVHDPDIAQILELHHGFDAWNNAGFAQSGKNLPRGILYISRGKSRCAKQIQFRNRRFRMNLKALSKDDFTRRRPFSRKYQR